MVWIFALGVIGFCLMHKGFRKFVFWIAGLAAIVIVYFAVH
jgi:hypothetical protein